MKFKQSDIGKCFIIKWDDALCEMSANFDAFLKRGLAVNNTCGWLKYSDKKITVVATETCSTFNGEDLVGIPTGWIKEIKRLK